MLSDEKLNLLINLLYMKRNQFLVCFILMGLILVSCASDKKEKKQKKKEKIEKALAKTTLIPQDSSITTGCDTSLWRYVYNRERLDLINLCKTVTGVVEESNADEDGDQHMLLKLDPGQETLLTKFNMKKKQGDLVIEAVCANNVIVKKVKGTCEGYTSKIQLPKIGDHIRVTGSYVIDGHSGWAEIHPIMTLEFIRQ